MSPLLGRSAFGPKRTWETDHADDRPQRRSHSIPSRSQATAQGQRSKETLAIYSFMFGPERERPCPGCTHTLDCLDGAVRHTRERFNFVVVAKSPLPRILAFADERGWRHLRLLSTAGNSYDRDYFGDTTALTPGLRKQQEFKPDEKWDMPMLNVFRRNGNDHPPFLGFRASLCAARTRAGVSAQRSARSGLEYVRRLAPGPWRFPTQVGLHVGLRQMMQKEAKGQAMAKNTICLWYDKDAEAAARFYAETFPDSAVGAVHRAPSDYPSGKKGDVLTVEFTVAGVPCIGLNGGPAFKHNEAFSFQIATDDQQETDRYWNAIVGNGGQESACGWCKDKWGVSWQITPRVLTEAMAAGGAEAKRAFDAMMDMKKIDVAAIKAARRG